MVKSNTLYVDYTDADDLTEHGEEEPPEEKTEEKVLYLIF